jgi:hypothetical protein
MRSGASAGARGCSYRCTDVPEKAWLLSPAIAGPCHDEASVGARERAPASMRA